MPSTTSAAPSGVTASSPTSIGGANATCTRRGFGNGPRNSASDPVIAAGTIGAPSSSASRPAPRLGWPSSSGSRMRVPSGKSARRPPWRSTVRAVSSASSSDEPRRTGKAPSRTSSLP